MNKACIAVLAIFVLIGNTAAAAPPNKPLAENIAALAVAKRWCTNYHVDLESGVALAVEKGINPLKGEFNRMFEDTKEKLEGYMENLGVSKWCEITYNRFKPGGTVPGFMMKK